MYSRRVWWKKGKSPPASAASTNCNEWIEGAGSVKVLNLDAPKLIVDLSGAGSANIAGKATEQDIKLTGVCNYESANTESQKVMVAVKGVGHAKVHVKSVLTATMNGIGSIEYIAAVRTLLKRTLMRSV